MQVQRREVESRLQSAMRFHLDLTCAKLNNMQGEFKETTRKVEEKYEAKFGKTKREREETFGETKRELEETFGKTKRELEETFGETKRELEKQKRGHKET